MAYKPSAQTLARAALARSKMTATKKTASAPEKKPEDTGDEGPSAAQAKKIKVEPRKMVAIDPNSVRAVNAARQQAYMAKGGRQPIGAMGSGGSNVMAGSGQSTIKDIKASIRAGVNPRVSLDPYESEKAKKVGPRTLKKESIDEALSPERKKLFDLKLKMIKKVANKKAYTKSSKVDAPHSSLNPAQDMKLTSKAPSGSGRDYYKEDAIVEGSKEEAEKLLGGPVKTRTGNEPKGKLPLGFRQTRNLARKAMKAGKPVTESTAEVNEMSHGKALAKMIMAKKSQHPIAQHMGEEKDEQEYGYEGDMAMSQLKSIIANAQRLHDMLEPNTDLPEWVQSKITLAEDYVVTAANYCASDLDEEVEQIDELDKSTLKSYVKKASGEMNKAYNYHQMRYGGRDGTDKNYMKNEYPKAVAKYDRRDAGVEKAKQKLAQEEVESVDEKYMGFKAVEKAAAAGGARNPAAVAAAIGRKKYGKEKFQAMAAAGKKHANEEVVTEAEGSIPKTPKEKELARKAEPNHLITHRDVITARLQSIAAKKMGK